MLCIHFCTVISPVRNLSIGHEILSAKVRNKTSLSGAESNIACRDCYRDLLELCSYGATIYGPVVTFKGTSKKANLV